MKRSGDLVRAEVRLARRRWGALGRERIKELRHLLRRCNLSVSLGDVVLLNSRWYVTHAGLLRCARRRRCSGIKTILDENVSDPKVNRWVFKAIVYSYKGSKGFVGYGDADPSNTSPLVRGAEMRVAETRAVNRALRKAYGIGLCSVEELGAFSDPPRSSPGSTQEKEFHTSKDSSNGQPLLRDQLCLLIRRYNLDATLVKAYAADYCGTQTLSGASRDLVESFISHLGSAAREDRDALVCKLNSYAQPQETRS